MAIEDLLTYTEVDPTGHLAVTSPRVTFTDLGRNEETYLYDDKGAGGFSGAVIHEGSFKISSSQTFGTVFVWGWANVIDDLSGPIISGDSISIRHNRTAIGLNRIILQESVGGSGITSSFNGSLIQYWVRIIHDPTFGSFGKITAEIYTDASRSTLVATLSLALNAVINFRYFYPCSAFNNGVSNTVSGFSEEWNLNAGVGSGRRRRMLVGRP